MKILTQLIKSFFLFFTVLLIICAGTVSAEMSCLTDSQLSEITGTGIIAFNLADNLARIDAGFDMGTYMQIDSMKLGYYDDGVSTGWDQDWTDVTFGTDTDELKIKGIYVETAYADINNSASRDLTSIKVGTTSATGSITGLLNSFSGLVTGTNGETIINGHRLPVAPSAITLDNSEAYIELDASGGYSIHFTNATIVPIAPSNLNVL